MHVHIDSSIAHISPSFYMRAVEALNVDIQNIESIDQQREALITTWKKKDKNDIEDSPFIDAYRDIIKTLNPGGMISFENMIRRCLLGGRFPTINPVVDICNIVSVQEGLPIGVFDLDTLREPVQLRMSKPGDRAQLFGQKIVEAIDLGHMVLEDEEGVFGVVGLRDSIRTMVQPTSTNILIVSFGDERVDEGALVQQLERCRDWMLQCKGSF